MVYTHFTMVVTPKKRMKKMLMAQKKPVNCHTRRTESLSYFSFYLFLFHAAVFSLCDGLALYTLVVSSVVFCHVFCF